MNTEQLLYWIKEREAIRILRATGAPPPWTDDPILREWSFCNVRRQHDRVSRWIMNNWVLPHDLDPDLWFAMVVARFVNWPDTLEELGYPVPYDPERFLAVMAARAARGATCFGPAYNISNGGKSTPKPQHLVQQVFAPLWSPLARNRLRPRDDDTLLTFYGRLKQMPGFASFMAGQVVADLKWVFPLLGRKDWFSFVVPGNGSRRGLNRVLGRPVGAPWQNDDSWCAAFRQLHEAIEPELERIGFRGLHAQDLQNCLCELDKFERVRLGEGKPKRRFKPEQ
jgi:hypothetical protein